MFLYGISKTNRNARPFCSLCYSEPVKLRGHQCSCFSRRSTPESIFVCSAPESRESHAAGDAIPISRYQSQVDATECTFEYTAAAGWICEYAVAAGWICEYVVATEWIFECAAVAWWTYEYVVTTEWVVFEYASATWWIYEFVGIAEWIYGTRWISKDARIFTKPTTSILAWCYVVCHVILVPANTLNALPSTIQSSLGSGKPKRIHARIARLA